MPFPFADRTFQFETLRALGYANNGGSDANEIFELCRNIRDGNLDDWMKSWSEAGKRCFENARQSQKNKDFVSAKNGFLRASNYLRTSEFFRRQNPLHDEAAKQLSQAAKDAFVDAMKISLELSYEPFKISTQDGIKISGYIISPRELRKRATIIVNGGFDGTKEESYIAFGVAAIQRGLNFVGFDGPGQGSIIREEHIPFRPDWNTVVTPLVDHLLSYEEIIEPDKLILIGWSMGGWLAAQTLTKEHRFCAAILNDGVFDFAAGWRKSIPGIVWSMVANGYYSIASIVMAMAVKNNVGKNWALSNALWTFGVDDAATLLTKIVQYTLTDESVQEIQTPLLILDPENDHLLGGQPFELVRRLNGDQEFEHHIFPTNEGAGEHCQMGAMAEQDRIMYGWIFKYI